MSSVSSILADNSVVRAGSLCAALALAMSASACATQGDADEVVVASALNAPPRACHFTMAQLPDKRPKLGNGKWTTDRVNVQDFINNKFLVAAGSGGQEYHRDPSTGRNFVFRGNYADTREAPMELPVELPTVPAEWKLAGTASVNFKGTNISNIFWRNVASGAVAVWVHPSTLLTPTVTKMKGLLTVPLEWELQAVGSTNAASTAQLLWRNAVTGQNVIWDMGGEDGTELLRWAFIDTVVADPSWRMAGAMRGFDSYGSTVIIWRNEATEQTVAWTLADQGTRLVSWKYLSNASKNWKVLATDFDLAYWSNGASLYKMGFSPASRTPGPGGDARCTSLFQDSPYSSDLPGSSL